MWTQIRPRTAAARHGLSVVEVLIVVGIIITLFAILVPAVAAVRGSARSTQCQANLKNLHNAYAARVLSSNDISPWAWRWEEVMVEQVGQDARTAFNCPETTAQAGVTTGSVWFIQFRKYGEVRTPFDVGNGRVRIQNPAGNTTLENFINETLTGTYTIEVEGDKDLGIGNNTSNLSNDNFETIETVIKITPDPVSKGQATLNVTYVEAGRDLEIIRFADNKPVNYDGTSATNAANKKTVSAGQTITLTEGFANSYGMNAAVHQFRQDGGKVLMADYNYRLIDVFWESQTNYPGHNKSLPSEWSGAAPVHGGSMNVLFAGGEVQQMSITDLSPLDFSNRLKYFTPAYLNMGYLYVDSDG